MRTDAQLTASTCLYGKYLHTLQGRRCKVNDSTGQKADEQVAAIERVSSRAIATVGSSSVLNGVTLAVAGGVYGVTVALVGLAGPARPRPLLAGVVVLLGLGLLAVTWWSRTRRRGARAGWRRAAGSAQTVTLLLWVAATITADSSAVTLPDAVWLAWAFATAAPMVAVGVREALPRPKGRDNAANGAPLAASTATPPRVRAPQFASERDLGALGLLGTGIGFGVLTVFIGAFRSHMQPVMFFVLLTTAIGLAGAFLRRRSPRALAIARLLTLALYLAAGVLSATNVLPASLLPWVGIGVLVAAPALVVGARALPGPRG